MIHLKKIFTALLCGGMIVGIHVKAKCSESVYAKRCALCHGIQGEGNPSVPDAPALDTLSEEELASKLSLVKGEGIDHAHQRMEKNKKIIELRTINYKSHEMAEYIYKNFNTKK